MHVTKIAYRVCFVIYDYVVDDVAICIFRLQSIQVKSSGGRCTQQDSISRDSQRGAATEEDL